MFIKHLAGPRCVTALMLRHGWGLERRYCLSAARGNEEWKHQGIGESGVQYEYIPDARKTWEFVSLPNLCTLHTAMAGVVFLEFRHVVPLETPIPCWA